MSCGFLAQGRQADMARLERELRVLDAEVGEGAMHRDWKVWYVPVGIVVGEGGEDKRLQAGPKGS
jgi:hypothetical protein